ncbi:hypothetical protein B0H14DRAFT_3143666 [Mycena olivaceomarginata]|nr:hypothetical protein B0H14DRAFT_3143666 [Mycena olivaceomarginata]
MADTFGYLANAIHTPSDIQTAKGAATATRSSTCCWKSVTVCLLHNSSWNWTMVVLPHTCPPQNLREGGRALSMGMPPQVLGERRTNSWGVLQGDRRVGCRAVLKEEDESCAVPVLGVFLRLHSVSVRRIGDGIGVGLVGLVKHLGGEEERLAHVGVHDGAHLAGDAIFDADKHFDLWEVQEVQAEREEGEGVVPSCPVGAPAGGKDIGSGQVCGAVGNEQRTPHTLGTCVRDS